MPSQRRQSLQMVRRGSVGGARRRSSISRNSRHNVDAQPQSDRDFMLGESTHPSIAFPDEPDDTLLDVEFNDDLGFLDKSNSNGAGKSQSSGLGAEGEFDDDRDSFGRSNSSRASTSRRGSGLNVDGDFDYDRGFPENKPNSKRISRQGSGLSVEGEVDDDRRLPGKSNSNRAKTSRRGSRIKVDEELDDNHGLMDRSNSNRAKTSRRGSGLSVDKGVDDNFPDKSKNNREKTTRRGSGLNAGRSQPSRQMSLRGLYSQQDDDQDRAPVGAGGRQASFRNSKRQSIRRGSGMNAGNDESNRSGGSSKGVTYTLPPYPSKYGQIPGILMGDLWCNDGEVVFKAICVLADIAGVDDDYVEDRELVHELGGAYTIVAVMMKWHRSIVITIAGLRAIANLGANSDFRDATFCVGGLEVALTAMKNFPKDQYVQRNGCAVICRFCYDTKENGADFVNDFDGLVYLVHAIRTFPGNMVLQNYAISALYEFSTVEQLHYQIVESGVAEPLSILAEALQEQPDQRELWMKARVILNKIND